MKNILLLIFLLIFFQNKAQKISSSLDKALDRDRVTNTRKINKNELTKIKSRKLISSLAQEGYINSYANTQLGMFPRHSLLVKIKKNNHIHFYRGIGWNWGTLNKNNFIINGQLSIELADGLITKENAKDYRYRIIQNDNKELIGWTIPNKFKKTEDGSGSYAYLGKINYRPNQFIQVEIYNLKDYRDRDALIVDWRSIRQFNCWTVLQYKANNQTGILMSASLGQNKMAARKKWNFIETEHINNIKFRLADSLVLIKFQSQNSPTLYNYQVVLQRTIHNKTDTINLGDTNNHFELHKEFWNSPGLYKVTFTPKLLKSGKLRTLSHDKDFTYQFTVLSPIHQKWLISSKEMILISLIISLIFFGAIFYLKRRNILKLIQEQQKRDLIKIQLQAIRSQLNPHFMFNALASIQNLMNKNEINTAGEYLGRFARLTRHVLLSREMVTLQEEYKLLDDYLSMEQLRFGFHFDINIEHDLDIANIEIPAMLLQVFVENAVKHGVASLKDKGNINILFEKMNNNLILTISDNGTGFNSTTENNGFGLKLSEKRVLLLNNIYKDTNIQLSISTQNGTTVVVTLNRWL